MSDVVEKVSSRALPGLDRSPNKNWVENTGGLPSYIDRIARHLHTEQGMTISHAIAAAIETVKRWAAGGGGVKPDTRAQAQAAVAEWEAKRAASRTQTAASHAAHKSLTVPESIMVDDDEIAVEPVVLKLAEGPSLVVNTADGETSFSVDPSLDVAKAIVSLPPSRHFTARPLPETEGIEFDVAGRKVVWAPVAKDLGLDVADAEIVFVGDDVDGELPDDFDGVLWPADDAGTMFTLAVESPESDPAPADLGIFKRMWGPFSGRR